VEAARAGGTDRLRIVLEHLGAQPPYPEWGAMISHGRNYLLTWWWYSTFPGLAIYLTVLGFNLVGDGLRDLLDPKSRG